MVSKVRIEGYDDWERVFFDDELVADGHSTDFRDLLERLGLEIEVESFEGQEHGESSSLYGPVPYRGQGYPDGFWGEGESVD